MGQNEMHDNRETRQDRRGQDRREDSLEAQAQAQAHAGALSSLVPEEGGFATVIFHRHGAQQSTRPCAHHSQGHCERHLD